jgi:hypothetical protein
MNDEYHLAVGPHRRPGGGRCAMEWVAHLAGEPHTDAPATVSPVLAAFTRSFNDALEDGPRQRLRPYLVRTIGTAADGRDDWRAWLCADWLVRTCAPAMLDRAGLREHASALRRLAPLEDEPTARHAHRRLHAARAAAARERGTARAAAAPDGTTFHTAPDGARHAARSLPRTAGWDAARAGVRGAAAPCAIRETAAETACQAARDAAWTAAWRAAPAPWPELRPIAEALQRSAFDLLDRMLPGVALDVPAPLADPSDIAAPAV